MYYDVIALGEPLIRYEPNNQYQRLERADLLKMVLGGAELNVTAALANIGNLETAIITKLPMNSLGKWVKHELHSYNVGTKLIAYGGERVGCYYSEKGSGPRTASVVYDRKHSSFAESTIQDYTLENYSAKIFHTTGITLALSESTRKTAIEIIKFFKDTNTLVSFDVNYRPNLWSEEDARKTIEKILPYVDIFFVGKDTCNMMFGYPKDDVSGLLKEFAEKYNIRIVASTQRNVISQSNHQISSIVYDKYSDTFYHTQKPYDLDIIDRVGSGDAYIAGMLYGLLENSFDCQIAQEYADAFSAFKCTIPGDILISSKDEISRLIEKHKKGIKEDIRR